MKSLFCSWFVLASLLLIFAPAQADDTCVFGVTANDVPPNVVVLLDNGTVMEHVVWHGSFDNGVDHTPAVAVPSDVVPNGAAGNGFFNANGYSMHVHGGNYYLVPIGNDLLPDTAVKLQETGGKGSRIWTINSRTVTLPADPSSAVDADGIKDNATRFRYSKNYLNWLFFGSYVGDGSDLPDKSRFYHAKKAIMTFTKMGNNRVSVAIYNFANTSGASQVQPIKKAVLEPLAADPADNVLDPNYINAINNMGTVDYSPLAEGLATIGGYFNNNNSQVVGESCQKNFVIVVTPGLSSEDGSAANPYVPGAFGDYDGDGAAGAIGEGWIQWGTEAGGFSLAQIPVGFNGTTDLDDVAHYLYENDVVGYQAGFQNLMTYTVGFMGDGVSNRFLINTSNNGNGNANLYDTSDLDYGKYHFEATSPDTLAGKLLEALDSILERTNAFAAPVVPVTRTTSGDRLYMSFFTPKNDTNFWVGNVMKLGLDENNQIIDQKLKPATHPNGAIKEDIEPFWQTIDWADEITYGARTIYTYLGSSPELTDASNLFNDTNVDSAILGGPVLPASQVIDYIRGADILDEDGDGITAENRAVITGDVLHSEPLVYEYLYSDGDLTLTDVSVVPFEDDEIIKGSQGGWARVQTNPYRYYGVKSPFQVDEVITGQTSGATATITDIPDLTMIFFGANDGMLHAVEDTNGSEAWGFIPPDQLGRLKEILEAPGHQYYIDASPRIFHKDLDGDGFLTDVDGDGIWTVFDDQLILVCGERKGGDSYFALDITDPEEPKYLWRITGTDGPAFDILRKHYPELGESWSEPNFGWVQTNGGDKPVMFIGGGYDATHATGNSILAVNVLTGEKVKTFDHLDMFSIVSTVAAVDYDNSGFIDVVYVGDTGGRLWRLGRFTDGDGVQLDFPGNDENIDNWDAVLLFDAGCHEGNLLTCSNGVDDNGNGTADERRSFFYPPSIVLDLEYDLIFMGTGSREDPCEENSDDRVLVVKDDHSTPLIPLTFDNLADAAVTTPQLDCCDHGWYRKLDPGEKILAEMIVFYGVLYFTTFTPNDDVCVPGGLAKLYALNYKTGDAAMDFDGDGTKEVCVQVGGGIPSKPVLVIGDNEMGLFVSVGSANPSPGLPGGAAIPYMGGTGMNLNFFYVWWQEVFD